MPHVNFDESNFYFPSHAEADEEGLLLIGGKVTTARVLEAYKKGIFPWYNEDELPLWWSPDPRFVLFPEDLHISRSMQKVLVKNLFEFKIDTAFEKVMANCAAMKRKDQSGTWITDDMVKVYTDLHYLGYAHSAETWKDGKLVGGMYGIALGSIFFGESMFSTVTNASKFAFINVIRHLTEKGLTLLDCQVYTEHVESLGARLIPRENYIALLEKFVLNNTQLI